MTHPLANLKGLGGSQPGIKLAPGGLSVAMPPEDLLAEIGQLPSSFAWSIDHIRHETLSFLENGGLHIRDFNSILDFGCGLGRFLMAMQPLLGPSQKLFGAELAANRATWCQQNLTFAEVINNSVSPPLAFAAAQFDLLFAFSVFTHLRLDLQFAWAAEVDRVLAPGGVTMLTTHGPSFFSSFSTQRSATANFGLTNVGDSGLFATLVFGEESDVKQGQVDVATAHHPDLVKLMFRGFELISYCPRTILAGGQDLYIFRKPHGRATRALPESGEVQYIQGAGQPNPRFKFQVSNHTKFSCLVSLEPFGDYPVDLYAQIGSPAGVRQHMMALNANRIFGAGQFLQLDLPLLEAGEVEIVLEARARSAPPPERITWLHPACYAEAGVR